jgi:hypothetical protein
MGVTPNLPMEKCSMNRVAFALLAVLASVITAADAPAQVSEPNKTGYSSVAAALDALKTKPGTKVTATTAWTTIEDMEGEDIVLWSFTVPTHAAHPSAVKRVLQKRADGYYIDMSILCESVDRGACAGLARSFQALNEQVKRSLGEGK